MSNNKYIDEKIRKILKEDVIVPDIVNEKSNEAYDLIREISKRDEKTTSNKKYKYIAIASIATIIIGSVSLTNNTVQAYMNKIKSQIEYFFDQQNTDFSDYKQYVNKIATDKDTSIIINEIMLDGEDLLISVDIDDSKLDKDKLGITNNSPLTVNAPKIIIGDMEFVNTGKSAETVLKEDGTYSTLLTCSLTNLDTDGDGKANIKNFKFLDNIKLEKDYDIKIIFNKIECIVNKEVKGNNMIKLNGELQEDPWTGDLEGFAYIPGNWEINTKINPSKCLESIKEYEVNKEINIDTEDVSGTLMLTKVKVTPSKININIKSKIHKNNINPDIENSRTIEIILRDEDGKVYNGDGAIFEINANNDEINAEFSVSNIDKMIIIPQISTWMKSDEIVSELLEEYDTEIDLKKKN